MEGRAVRTTDLLIVGAGPAGLSAALAAAQAGVKLTRMADYGVMGPSPAGERTVLLGFAGMDEEQIEQGLAALARAWK